MYRKAVVVIIDALRFDFISPVIEGDTPESVFYHHKLEVRVCVDFLSFVYPFFFLLGDSKHFGFP